MTDKTPTTADCVEWLNSQITYAAKCSLPKYLACAKAIEDQLIAAQEMAKALEINLSASYTEGQKTMEAAEKALTAWHACGGL